MHTLTRVPRLRVPVGGLRTGDTAQAKTPARCGDPTTTGHMCPPHLFHVAFLILTFGSGAKSTFNLHRPRSWSEPGDRPAPAVARREAGPARHRGPRPPGAAARSRTSLSQARRPGTRRTRDTPDT